MSSSVNYVKGGMGIFGGICMFYLFIGKLKQHGHLLPFYVLEDLSSVFKFLMCSIWGNTVAKGSIHGKKCFFFLVWECEDTFNGYT